MAKSSQTIEELSGYTGSFDPNAIPPSSNPQLRDQMEPLHSGFLNGESDRLPGAVGTAPYLQNLMDSYRFDVPDALRGIARAPALAGETFARISESFGRFGTELFLDSTPEEKAKSKRESEEFFGDGRDLLDEYIRPTRTIPGKFAEIFTQKTIEAAPALAMVAPLAIPAIVGKFVLSLAPSIGFRAAFISGAIAEGIVGVAQFGASSEVPAAILEKDAMLVFDAAAHPFIATAGITKKLASGRPEDITFDEYLNGGFMLLFGTVGARRFMSARSTKEAILQSTRVQARVVAEKFVKTKTPQDVKAMRKKIAQAVKSVEDRGHHDDRAAIVLEEFDAATHRLPGRSKSTFSEADAAEQRASSSAPKAKVETDAERGVRVMADSLRPKVVEPKAVEPKPIAPKPSPPEDVSLVSKSPEQLTDTLSFEAGRQRQEAEIKASEEHDVAVKQKASSLSKELEKEYQIKTDLSGLARVIHTPTGEESKLFSEATRDKTQSAARDFIQGKAFQRAKDLIASKGSITDKEIADIELEIEDLKSRRRFLKKGKEVKQIIDGKDKIFIELPSTVGTEPSLVPKIELFEIDKSIDDLKKETRRLGKLSTISKEIILPIDTTEGQVRPATPEEVAELRQDRIQRQQKGIEAEKAGDGNVVKIAFMEGMIASYEAGELDASLATDIEEFNIWQDRHFSGSRAARDAARDAASEGSPGAVPARTDPDSGVVKTNRLNQALSEPLPPVRSDNVQVLNDKMESEAFDAENADIEVEAKKTSGIQTEVTVNELSDSLPNNLSIESSVEELGVAVSDLASEGNHAERYKIGVILMAKNGEIIEGLVELDGGMLEDGDTFTIGSISGKVKRRDGEKIVIELKDGREVDTFILDISDPIYANPKSFVRNNPTVINQLRNLLRKGARNKRREDAQKQKQFKDDIGQLKKSFAEDMKRLKASDRNKAKDRSVLIQATLKRLKIALKYGVDKRHQYKLIPEFIKLAKHPTEDGLKRALTKITKLHDDAILDDARSDAKSLYKKMSDKGRLLSNFKTAFQKIKEPDFSKMTLDEALDFYGRLQRIRAGNNLSRRTIINGQDVEAKEVEAASVGDIRSRGLVVKLKPTEVDEGGRIVVLDEDVALLTKFGQMVFGTIEHINPDNLLELVGGEGSTLHQVAYDEIRQGISRARAGTQQAADFVKKVAAQNGVNLDEPSGWYISTEYAGLMSHLESLSSNVEGQVKPGRTKAELRDVIFNGDTLRQYTPAELMDLYNALKDNDFMLRLLAGAPWRPSSHGVGTGIVFSENDILKIRKSTDVLSHEERAIADALFDYVNNIEGPKYGKWADLELGHDNRVAHKYWHIDRNVDPNENLESALAQFNDRLVTQANLAKDRGSDLKSEMIGGDIFRQFHNHVHIVEHLVELSQPLKQARRLINAGAVKKILMGSPHGKRLHSRLMAQYQQLAIEAIGGSHKSVGFAGGLRWTMRNLSSLLAFNPKVILYQHASIFTALDVIPGKYLKQAEADNSAFNADLDREIWTDPDLRARMETNASYLLTEGLTTVSGARLGGKPTLMQHGMKGIRAADQTVIRALWQAAKYAGQDQGLEGDALRSFQAELTNKAVRRTQPTSDTIDASALAIEAKTDTGAMLINMFRSARSRMASVLLTRLMKIIAGVGNPREHIVVMAVAAIGPAIAVAVVQYLFRLPFQDEDDREKENTLKAFAVNVMANVAGVFPGGDYAASVVAAAVDEETFDPNNPLSSVFGKVLYGIEDLVNLEDDEGLLDQIEAIMISAEAISAIWGKPFSWPIGFARKIYKMSLEKNSADADLNEAFR